MIAIIDYGMGNLRSVQKALEKAGAGAVITQEKEEIKKADKVVLPGVGAMLPAMMKLKNLGLIEPIREIVKLGKPFLGICLGLQLLFEEGDEGGKVEGLGIFKGRVERFPASGNSSLKVPHMGWNQIQIKNKKCALFQGIENLSSVYFCHSYFVKPKETAVTATVTDYGIQFTSSICRDSVFGVQFHPEKSQEVGLRILRNFVEI